MKKTILISGMTCGHCVKRVETALLGIAGIVSAVVSLDEKSAVVDSNVGIDDNLIKEAIDDAGYDVESIQ